MKLEQSKPTVPAPCANPRLGPSSVSPPHEHPGPAQPGQAAAGESAPEGYWDEPDGEPLPDGSPYRKVQP